MHCVVETVVAGFIVVGSRLRNETTSALNWVMYCFLVVEPILTYHGICQYGSKDLELVALAVFNILVSSSGHGKSGKTLRLAAL